MFGGIKIFTDEHLGRITRQRRTHRKRRINKKWAKRYGFEQVYSGPKCYQAPFGFVCNPPAMEAIRQQCEIANNQESVTQHLVQSFELFSSLARFA